MRQPDTKIDSAAQPGASGSQVQGSQTVAQSSAQIGAQTGTQAAAEYGTKIGTQISAENGCGGIEEGSVVAFTAFLFVHMA
ncbi:unnamed protein product [Trifolium pratense]|uniref:Uncharacterized protein n=1 Tax=Trifolium pratense TaxID=57577 RepID=A0ACB0IU13_TRIPR|nr:unnamed protein product [Trifolium pratense]